MTRRRCGGCGRRCGGRGGSAPSRRAARASPRRACAPPRRSPVPAAPGGRRGREAAQEPCAAPREGQLYEALLELGRVRDGRRCLAAHAAAREPTAQQYVVDLLRVQRLQLALLHHDSSAGRSKRDRPWYGCGCCGGGGCCGGHWGRPPVALREDPLPIRQVQEEVGTRKEQPPPPPRKGKGMSGLHRFFNFSSAAPFW